MQTTTIAPATERQVAFLARLAAERGLEPPAGELSKTAASAAIDQLLATPAPGAPVRPNRYAGTCRDCRNPVPADIGRIEKVDGRWITRHLEGACPATAPAPELPTVPEGRYAFTADEGHTAFAKVDHGKGRWDGYTFVRLLIGSPGDLREQRLSRAAGATILAKITEAGIAESMARFGHEVGCCGRCGAALTDPESIARGIGPVCYGRVA